MATVELSDDAEEWLQQADADVQEQVLKRINRVSDFPEHFLEYYRGADYYKLRAGDYRATVEWDKDAGHLRIIRIGHRDKFYDR
ncbi:type II toxin-antitoxin system RelE/ParE family toxin [Halomicroarcula sp. S1AR25-4]|uniref:type II toxin-antitoxin system RelE family toxin n=1 Tax=Haloarcula sp. S1AR25-4 TaxID=2950538 RepID=UPI002875954E|nr:type II toxin-antitoxin system RelE/ParE family toxin [Halomicroarcula sp. S1AR25-4]MDS0280013.1 type II toxin-antitoxin system RelE/ParE family toxin [Halomicroarcula sp. S1AR25-4]